MATGYSAIGQNRSWVLLNKIGEGDAGEVFLVESLLDHREAILKRPLTNAFSSDVIRQATQIQREGEILRVLNGLLGSIRQPKGLRLDISTPILLDQSNPGTEYSERFFIVLEKVKGVNLNTFARVIRQDLTNLPNISDELKKLYESLSQNQTYPRLILLRSLASVLLMFETIHNFTRLDSTLKYSGIIWNDVKPEHIFWDVQTKWLTVIDWGNAQFLESDGFTKDRQSGRNNDYSQFLATMGAFIHEHDPELKKSLKWPVGIKPIQTYTESIKTIKQSIIKILGEELAALEEARQAEIELVHLDNPTPEKLEELIKVQDLISSLGELPDYSSADNFCVRLANQLMAKGRLTEFIELSNFACRLHHNNPQKWKILNQLVLLVDPQNPTPDTNLHGAISAGIVDNWSIVLWNLALATGRELDISQWDELSRQIRQFSLNIEPNSLPPLLALKRTILSLQAEVQRLRDLSPSKSPNVSFQGNIPGNSSEWQNELEQDELTTYEDLVNVLRNDILAKWPEFEPDPPDAGLEYSDIDRQMEKIEICLPAASQSLDRALIQPRAQVKIILDSWEQKKFDTARHGLRSLLLWDPDRRRVLLADKAITFTPKWLARIQQGPQNDQQMVDFVTEGEFTGRELRNHIGPATWLDIIIDVFSQLRKGRRIAELLVENPSLTKELPWLEMLEPRKYMPSHKPSPIKMDREDIGINNVPTFNSHSEALLGQDRDILLTESLDTWAPEARGSSARVFVGFLRNYEGQMKQAAVKIMRSDQISYALPLFREEALILSKLNGTPGITPLLECGFIKLDAGQQLPADNRSGDGRDLTGIVLRYGPDQITSFLPNLETNVHQGLLPYLVIPKYDNKENLMWICDAGYTRGKFIPIEQSLRLAMQICDLIQVAHSSDISYRDHKLLHYYWSEQQNGVYMIDWNVARYYPEGVSRSELEFDLVQLGARALHHIFTGRVAPGALADGPNRVEEVESAAHSYGVQWTYDDQRLPPDLKEMLARLLGGNYTSANLLKEDLFQVYNELISESNYIIR